MKKKGDLIEREYIYILKALAVFSIVAAHCVVIEGNINKINILFARTLDELGSIGVAVFYIISGYLFCKNKSSIGNFFVKKISTIIIPWFATGSLVYLYIILRKGEITFLGWIQFILGNGSYLYFLTLLIIFYVIFFYNLKKIKLIITFMFVSFISIILTSNGKVNFINPYLNCFNFICYFATGILIARFTTILSLGKKLYKYRFVLLIIYSVLQYIAYIYNISTGYWGYATLIVQPIAIGLILGWGSKWKVCFSQVLEIGKRSFSIYLLHLPIAGIIVKILNEFGIWQATLIRPFIVILITKVAIDIYIKIIEGNKKEKYFKILIGLR